MLHLCCASPLVYFTQLLGVAVPSVFVTILFTMFLVDTVFQIIKKIIDMKKSKKTTSKKDKVTQVISVFGLVLQVGRLGTILRIRELFTWDEQRRPPNYIKVDILSGETNLFLLFYICVTQLPVVVDVRWNVVVWCLRRIFAVMEYEALPSAVIL